MAVDVSGVALAIGEVLIGATAVGLAGLSILIGINAFRQLREIFGGGSAGGYTPRQVAAIKAKQAAAMEAEAAAAREEAASATEITYGDATAEEQLSFDSDRHSPEDRADLISTMSDKHLWEYRGLVDSALNERSSTMVIEGKEEQVYAPDDAEAKRLMTEKWHIDNEIESRTHGF
jgi:hypothetical protein